MHSENKYVTKHYTENAQTSGLPTECGITQIYPKINPVCECNWAWLGYRYKCLWDIHPKGAAKRFSTALIECINWQMDYRCKYLPTNERPDPRNTTPSQIPLASTDDYDNERVVSSSIQPPTYRNPTSNELPKLSQISTIRARGSVLAGPEKPKNLFTYFYRTTMRRTAEAVQKDRRRSTDHDWQRNKTNRLNYGAYVIYTVGVGWSDLAWAPGVSYQLASSCGSGGMRWMHSNSLMVGEIRY